MVDIKIKNINKSSGRRILNDIVVSKPKVTAEQMFRQPQPSVRRPEKRARRVFKGRGKYFVGIVVFLCAGFVFGVVTRRMEIRVTPQSAHLAVNKTIPLSRKGDESGKLFMRTVAVPTIEEGVFDGEIASAPVERKAKGTVVIFNKSSEAPQTLIATTRLATPDGKLFRIPQTITVPGYRIENKEIIPGSREVEVIADKAGEEYNVDLVDFTIPGFAGGPKFKTIFGRSKTPMQGGFRGLENTVLPEDLDRAMIKLAAEAEAKASALLYSKIPKNSIVVPKSIESVVVDHRVEFLPERGANKFKLVLKIEARGATLDHDRVLQLFPEVKLPKPFRMVNLNELTYQISGYAYDGAPGDLALSGDAAFESSIDQTAIQKFVAGKRVSKSKDILSAFLSLAVVEVRFRPFWFKYPPKDSSRIDIILPVR
jgi:hypothetical protein